MQKEILTKEKIKYDYKKEFLKGNTTVIIMPGILILLTVLIIYLFSFLDKNFFLLEILFVLPPVFFVFICLAALFDSYKKYKIVKNDQFKVVEDKLVNTIEKKTYFGSAFAASFSNLYTLSFASYGEYAIPDGKNYSSSNIYAMSDKGVFIYSNIGDIFYLVIDRNENILLAYNKKLFEFQS